MDGLVCAVLLKHLNMIDDIKFVHPKDMQDGIIEITENDITTNLPYVNGVGIAFDHHLSETVRNKEIKQTTSYYQMLHLLLRLFINIMEGKQSFLQILSQ